MKFLELLRRKTPTTAAELTTALAEAEQAARDADARVEALTAERARLLLDGDDTAIDKIEAQLATAARDSDRAGLAVEELKRRLATATDAQRQAELDRAYEAALAAQQRGVAALKRYGKEAPKLAAILTEIDAAEIELQRHRETLQAAADPRWREAQSADRIVRPLPEGQGTMGTVVQLCELPSLDHFVSLWPPLATADVSPTADRVNRVFIGLSPSSPWHGSR